jgi:hypothetical protein
MIGRIYRNGKTAEIPWVREKMVLRIALTDATAIIKRRSTSSISHDSLPMYRYAPEWQGWYTPVPFAYSLFYSGS